MNSCKFTEQVIVIENYPYRSSSCFPNKLVSVQEIIDVSYGYPITIRLVNKDVIFISRELKKDVSVFVDRWHIPVVNRYDPWNYVLEPFLDTEYTNEDHEQAMHILLLNGITEEQCMAWRQKFKNVMKSYNFDSMLWEWCQLGASDLLDAHMGMLANKRFKLDDKDFEALYTLVVSVLFQAAEIGGASQENR